VLSKKQLKVRDVTIPKFNGVKDLTMQGDWLKFFAKIPRLEEIKSGSFSSLASSFVTCNLGSELREFAIMTKANSTMIDGLKDIRGDFPLEYISEDEPGKYKVSGGESFYVTDLERGLVFYKDSLTQKGSLKLKTERSVRVSLTMVGTINPVTKKVYVLYDVGSLQLIYIDVSLGSSRRVGNPINVDHLVAGCVTSPFVLGKNNYYDLKDEKGMVIDI
jgi:hypothetical protein